MNGTLSRRLPILQQHKQLSQPASPDHTIVFATARGEQASATRWSTR
jgi:hypothetical protein